MSDLLPIFIQKDVEQRFIASVMPLYRGNEVRANIQLESQKIEFSRAITGLKNWNNIPQGEIERVLYASAATGLTWAATEKNFYLIPRGGFLPTSGGGKVWSNEATLEMKVTADGETNLRIAEGQFKRLRGPYSVYEGDEWSYDPSGNKCHHVPKPDSEIDGSEKVVACYVFVVENDNSETLTVLDKRDILRLLAYSRRQNTPKDSAKVVAGKEYGNELYFSYNGGVDPGFAATKCRYKAFKGRPKCKNMRDIQALHQMEDEQYDQASLAPEGTVTIIPAGADAPRAVETSHEEVAATETTFDDM
jgi:hypothetical protein